MSPGKRVAAALDTVARGVGLQRGHQTPTLPYFALIVGVLSGDLRNGIFVTLGLK